MSRRLLMMLALIMGAVGAAEAATTSVKVVNGRGAPVPVMDQTVLQPVHGNASLQLAAGERVVSEELITPPAGKMVVIEHITVRAFVNEPTANALLTLSGDLGEDREVEHYLEAFPPPIDLAVVTALQQLLTQHVLLYSTGPVDLEINRGQKNVLSALFDVSFSGYLVKAPR